ncbi:hypothetical protein JL720_3187 [Aureococcus anophagefferens]|nr:hypothetical protein JL720_3187 [Aureococcus anophagefferens]
MALTHAYIRATKGTEKPDAASPTTLLQKVNDARRASEPGLPPGDEGSPGRRRRAPAAPDAAADDDDPGAAGVKPPHRSSLLAAFVDVVGDPGYEETKEAERDDRVRARAVMDEIAGATEAEEDAAEEDAAEEEAAAEEEPVAEEPVAEEQPVAEEARAEEEPAAEEPAAEDAAAAAAEEDDAAAAEKDAPAAEEEAESEEEDGSGGTEEDSDEEDSDEEEEGHVEYDSDGRPFVWRYDADGIRHKRRPGEDSDASSDEDEEESDDDAEEEEPEPVEDEAGRDLVEIAAIDDRELLDYSDLQTFSHLFKTVDVDKKGAVKHAAIGDHFTPLTSRGINPSQVRQVFECADRHSAGEVTMEQFLDFIGGKPPWYRDWLRHVADTQQAAFLGGMRIGG